MPRYSGNSLIHFCLPDLLTISRVEWFSHPIKTSVSEYIMFSQWWSHLTVNITGHMTVHKQCVSMVENILRISDILCHHFLLQYICVCMHLCIHAKCRCSHKTFASLDMKLDWTIFSLHISYSYFMHASYAYTYASLCWYVCSPIIVFLLPENFLQKYVLNKDCKR